jgi:hypothetical protein
MTGFFNCAEFDRDQGMMAAVAAAWAPSQAGVLKNHPELSGLSRVQIP